MRRALFLLLLILAITTAAYFALLNRQLNHRLLQQEQALREAQQQASLAPVDPDPIRRIPHRPPLVVVTQPRSNSSALVSAPDTNAVPLTGAAEAPAETGGPLQTQVVRLPVPLPPVAMPVPGWISFVAQPGSSCVVEGTSNIGDWRIETKVIRGEIKTAPELDFANRQTLASFPETLPCSVKSTVPARSLRSGKRSMDDTVHSSLGMRDFPSIEYQLRGLFWDDSLTNQSPLIRFQSVGDLTLHGVTRTVQMPVGIEPQENGWLTISGNTLVKMTEFGIQPPEPKLAMGTVTSGDEVKISFTWVARQAGP